MTWVLATLIAASAQTARNAMQSRMTATLGTLGATQLRFVYGFPFAVLFLLVVLAVSGRSVPAPTAGFLGFTTAGALAQICGTAALLASMRARSFAVAIAISKTEPIQVALFAFVMLGDRLTVPGMAAIAMTTVGIVLTAFRPGEAWSARNARPALLGIASGGLFALAAVGFRGGIVALDDGGYVLRATTTLVWSLGLQAGLLGVWMALFHRAALLESLVLWRQSLFAGFMGALASQFWFVGFALTAAANVRTLALVEVLFARLVSRRFFAERLAPLELAGLTLTVAGIALLLLSARP